MPRRNELVSIVNYGRSNPSIDSAYFPNSNSSNFWSASATADLSPYAWAVDFFYGDSGAGGRGSARQVRLVRGRE